MINKLFEMDSQFGTGTQLEFNVSKFFEDNILLKEYYPYQYNSWKDHKKYGILNTNNITIYPKTSALKDHTNINGYTSKNINFVTDAFIELRKAINTLYNKSVIDTNGGIYNTLNPVETYVDSPNLYVAHLNNLFNIFNNTYLTDEQKNNIVDIYSFIPYFIEYIKNVTDYVPINRQTYLRSSLIPDTATGLVISLDKGIREDQFMIKTNKYIGNKYFDTFLEMSGRFGFYVNRNAPWKIIADLDSPVMLSYAKNYGYNNVEAVFQNCYHEAYKTDLTVLKTIFINFWNAYSNNAKIVIKTDFAKNCDRLFTESIKLQPLSLETFDMYFSTNWLLRLYLYTRYLEEKIDITQNKFETLYSEACKINNFIDLENSLLFINTKIYDLAQKNSVKQEELTTNMSLDRLVSTNKFKLSSTDVKF